MLKFNRTGAKKDEEDEDAAKVEPSQIKRTKLKSIESKRDGQYFVLMRVLAHHTVYPAKNTLEISTLPINDTQEFSEQEKIAFQRLLGR